MADRISLKQLARELGLSESTVSKALNGRRDVSAEVRERVRELADALGYTPDPAARGLATGKRGAIGVYLLNRFGRPAGEYFGFNFLGGLMKEAQMRGNDLMVFQESDEAARDGYLHYARKRGVDGVVFVGMWPNDPLCAGLSDDVFPWVSIDTPIPGAARGFVSTDNRRGIRDMLEEICARGCRRIGYIGIHGGGYVGTERRAAFEDFCVERGLIDKTLMIDTALNMRAGYNAAMELLGGGKTGAVSGRERLEAIVCASDLQALGCLRAARDLGLSVPDDLGVAGFDDIPAASLSSPALTTAAQHADAIGRQAIASLLGEPNPEPVLIPARIVLRESL